MLKTRVAHGYCSVTRRRRLPLRQHLRTMRQLRRRPDFNPSSKPTRRHPRPARRRPSTRVDSESPPRTRRRQHRRHSDGSEIKPDQRTSADTTRGRLMERWFAELTNKWLRAGRTAASRSSPRPSPTVGTWNDDPAHMCAQDADEIFDSLAAYCERISESGD